MPSEVARLELALLLPLAVSARTCLPGEYAAYDSEGRGLCEACPAGKWADQSAPELFCLACPQGMHGTGDGAASLAAGCAACPHGTYGWQGGAATESEGCASSLCGAGQYRELESKLTHFESVKEGSMQSFAFEGVKGAQHIVESADGLFVYFSSGAPHKAVSLDDALVTLLETPETVLCTLSRAW